MHMRPFAGVATVLAALPLAAGPAAAADPLGLYVGAALGESRLSFDNSAPQGLSNFSEHHSAWKVMAGLRPLSFFGAEVEYVDFGHPSGSGTFGTAQYQADATAKALAVYGVGYLPLGPVAIYAKAGSARIDSTANARLTNCGVPLCVVPFHASSTTQHFGYGGGVRLGLGEVGVRAEYERVNASGANLDLLSVGLTWTF